jgi:hypothetical protein
VTLESGDYIMLSNNPIINQISEIYGSIKLYCIISNIKDEFKRTDIDDTYKAQLEEALQYAEKRKNKLIYGE